jgi:hypothetical protein
MGLTKKSGLLYACRVELVFRKEGKSITIRGQIRRGAVVVCP